MPCHTGDPVCVRGVQLLILHRQFATPQICICPSSASQHMTAPAAPYQLRLCMQLSFLVLSMLLCKGALTWDYEARMIFIYYIHKPAKAEKSAAGVGQRTFSCPAGVRGSQMCSERSAPPNATSCEPAGAAATQYTALNPSWRSVHVHISASHLLTCPMHTLISGPGLTERIQSTPG